MTTKFSFVQFVRIIFRQAQFDSGRELLCDEIRVLVHIPTCTRKPIVECVQRFGIVAGQKGQEIFANLADGKHAQ
jgi:hypothetical protein